MSLARRAETIVILGALTAFAPMSIDMYLPAFPALQAAFGTGPGPIQLTLATFFAAFACGQMFYGPLADRFGRKPPLYAGLLLFIASSIGCAFVTTVEAMLVLRLVQGLGACAGVVVARAMVSDLFAGREAARVFSLLMLVMGAAPVLAPLIGSYVIVWSSWPAIFILLALFGLLCLAAVAFRLPETHAAQPDRPLALSTLGVDLRQLLGDRRFMGLVLGGAFSIGGMFVYIAGSPFVFIELFGISPEAYGWLFGINALGIIGGSQLNARLVGRFGSERPLVVAACAQGVAGALLVAAALSGIGGMAGIVVPQWLFLACVGFTMPNTVALAMAPHRQRAGTASAALGTLQFGVAAVASTLIGAFHGDSALPMAIVMAAFALTGLASLRLLAADVFHGSAESP